MTQSTQQPSRPGSLPAELVLGIARDLEDVTDRIAEMKALCDQQMTDLADAAAAAAAITEVLAHRQPPVAVDADFAALGSELSLLYKTVEAQVGACQGISRQFLEIAREVGSEIATLRAAAQTPDSGPVAAAQGNVVWLHARRGAKDDPAAIQAVKDLQLALRAMQESASVLFRTQAESRKMVASLRQRMREHRRRTRRA